MKIIITFFFIVIQISGFSQITNNSFFDKSVEFSVDIFLTSKLNINRSYEKQTSDISSFYSPSIQTSLNFYKNLNHKLSFSMGGLVGIYSINHKLNIYNDFNNLGWSEFRGGQTDFEFPYLGLSLGIHRHFFLNKNYSWTLGIGINSIYFLKNDYKFSILATSKTGQEKLLFTSDFDVNNQNKIMIVPQFLISNFYKINKSFLLKFSVVAAFSNAKIFNGEYNLIGDTKILQGEISKKFKHIGIEFGILYNLKK